MFKAVIFLFCLNHLSLSAEGRFRKIFPPPVRTLPRGGDYGEPLFLTPYIDEGKIQEARSESRVSGLRGVESLQSYSGYFTVNPKYNSNLFFWFFPSANRNDPVVLWLQGGPGGSSLFGLFQENGPIQVNKDLNGTLRKYTWNNAASMLYIDNPVGTGFSFTDSDDGYVTNEVQVGNDLYEALSQFFKVFDDYKNNEFYVTGESYAGKYVPAIGHRIHINNSANINFKGVAIGNGLSDPITMLDYGDLLYQLGLVDEMQKNYIKSVLRKTKKLIEAEKYLEAFYLWDKIVNGDEEKGPSYFYNCTGLTDYFNFLYTVSPGDSYYNQYLALPEIRKAIHVGNLTYNDGATVEKHLLSDIMQSVKPWVEELMNNYRVLIYSGHLDIIVAAPLTENFLQTVQWKYAHLYRTAPRKIWKVDPSDVEVAGYIKTVHSFSRAIVRNAGHMVPLDQPRSAYDLIKRFLNNKL